MTCCEILEDTVDCEGLACEFPDGNKDLIINDTRDHLCDILVENLCEHVMLELKNQCWLMIDQHHWGEIFCG